MLHMCICMDSRFIENYPIQILDGEPLTFVTRNHASSRGQSRELTYRPCLCRAIINCYLYFALPFASCAVVQARLHRYSHNHSQSCF
jgi:hypothetical protein